MNPNFANREVCNLVFCDYKTKVPFLRVDYANVSSTEVTGDSVFAYGGQGHPKRISYNGNKAGTVSFETQIQTMQLYRLITGGTIEHTAKFIKREEITCAVGGELTFGTAAIAGTAYAYAVDDDCGTPIVGTGIATKFTATTAGDIEVGNVYIVYYLYNINSGVQKINIKGTTFPKTFIAYADTFNKTEDDEIVPYKFVAYKCAPQANFTLSFQNDGDPATMTVTCDLLVDGDDNMLDLILEEEDNTDYVGVTGITLNDDAINVAIGANTTLTATITPNTATNTTVTWTTANASIATVADGKVVGIAAGDTVISAQTEDGGYFANAIVTVA